MSREREEREGQECGDGRARGKQAGTLSLAAIKGELMPEEQTYQAALRNAVYSGVPDCGVLFKTDVAKQDLYPVNNLLFSSDGQYIVSRMTVTAVIWMVESIRKTMPNDMKRRIVPRSFMIRDSS